MSYDVFISYRRTDGPFVRALVDALETRGVGVWWDQMIEGGVDWRDAIVEGLEAADMLVIMFSDECNSSKQLKKELAMADMLNKDVVPVLIEDTKPKGHFLYELASRNWIQIHPDPMAKLDQLADHLTDLAKKSPGGLQGVSPAPAAGAPAAGAGIAAPAPAPDAAEAAASRAREIEKKVAAKAAATSTKKNLRDFLPFKWIDLVLLALVAGGTFAATGMPEPGGGDVGVLLATAILGIALIAAYGAVVFPFRYYFRRRRLWRAMGMYALSAIVLFGLLMGVFLTGKAMGAFPNDETATIAGVFGAAWLVFAMLAFMIYGVLNFQRAVRSFRSNTKTL